MISVFIDTFVVLTLNALVIISTLYTEGGPLANGYVGDVTSQLNSANLAQTAFGTVMGSGIGSAFVAICLFFFAFSTILGWNLFGKINVIYLFGKKGTVGLHHRGPGVHLPGHRHLQRPGVGPDGHVQLPHGHPQRPGPSSPCRRWWCAVCPTRRV